MKNISIKNLILEFNLTNQDGDIVGKKTALNGINLDVEEGSFICILGRNGCGKSTFAKTLNGLLLPTSGDVEVYGLNTKNEDDLINIRQKVGMAFQNPDNQIVASIVEEDVAFGLENLGIESSEIRKRIDESMKALSIYDLKDSLTSKLSGGQKQKVAIAGILAMKSKILVLDEPTSMIDKNGRNDLLNSLKKLNREEKLTIILISHFIEEISNADRVLVMSDGKIMMDDTPEKILLCESELASYGIMLPYIPNMATNLKKNGKKLKGNETNVRDLCQFLK